MRAIRAGDRRAAFELDGRWRPRIVGLARSILHDGELADDAAQGALGRVFLHLDRYDDSRRFEPWILKVAGNAIRDFAHKWEGHPPKESGDGSLENEPAPSAPVDDYVAFQEEFEALYACLEGLSGRSRVVVVLSALGFSDREIGGILDGPKSTVCGWRHKAMEQLRRCLESKGFT